MTRAVPVYMSLCMGINHVAVLDGASSRVKKNGGTSNISRIHVQS